MSLAPRVEVLALLDKAEEEELLLLASLELEELYILELELRLESELELLDLDEMDSTIVDESLLAELLEILFDSVEREKVCCSTKIPRTTTTTPNATGIQLKLFGSLEAIELRFDEQKKPAAKYFLNITKFNHLVNIVYLVQIAKKVIPENLKLKTSTSNFFNLTLYLPPILY